MSPSSGAPLLEVEGLRVSFPARRGRLPVLRGISFTLAAGEVLGLVGESGSGKSLTALALLGLLPPHGRIDGGRVRFAGQDLAGMPAGELRSLRGRRVAMVFQEPAAALNPVLRIGFQIAEASRRRRPLSRRQAREEAVRLLRLVAMPDPEGRIDSYPGELSGGQCQRALLAMALAGEPQLLIADEPTTALDVTVQAQVLALLSRLRRELGLAVLLITHDLGVVAETCDRVVVLYAGEVVEEAPVAALFAAPAHPYTRALLALSPRLGRGAAKARLPALPGMAPDPAALPPGCAFHPRCPEVFAPCAGRSPELYPLADGRQSRCFLQRGQGE